VDEAQNLVLSNEALPQANPDFLLMRVTDAGGKSFDFWVSVDRRESAYTITGEGSVGPKSSVVEVL
jgi:hypothetical protein